jgi:hypothetical protein
MVLVPVAAHGSHRDIAVEHRRGWDEDGVELGMGFGMGLGVLLLEEHAVVIQVLEVGQRDLRHAYGEKGGLPMDAGRYPWPAYAEG